MPSLATGLSFQLDLAARFLEFEFDEESGVTDADGDVGGLGLRQMAGAEYRF